MERTITIKALQEMGVDSWSVKDSSPRGIRTAYTSEIKAGDRVVIDDYFTTVTEAPKEASQATAEPQETHPVTIYERITAELERRKDRSAWGRGVNAYALELVKGLTGAAEYNERNPETLTECREWLLNGARDWSEYSYGGSALIYDSDIAERLCTPSELKKTRGGERNPNSRETWLDCQTRALFQACNRVTRLYNRIVKEG